MSPGSGQTVERTTRRGVLAGGALAAGVTLGATTGTAGSQTGGTRPATGRGRPATAGVEQGDGPTERWTRSVSDPTNLHASDGTYYLAAGGSLQAIDATSGRTAWTASVSGGVPNEGMALAPGADTAVAATDAGTVAGVALSDGTERWRQTTGGDPVGLAVGNGRAYLATTTGVTALDPASGEPIYTATPTEAEPMGVTAVEADAATETVIHTQTALVGLDGGGAETWRVTPEPPGFSDTVFLFTDNALAASGTVVYFQGKDGVNGVVDAEAGTLVWRRVDEETALENRAGGVTTFDGGAVTSGPNASVLALPGGSVRFRTGVRAYDAATGTSEALYVAGGVNETATLRSFTADGRINWSLEFSDYVPTNGVDEFYPFQQVAPAVTDGSLALVFGRNEPTVHCVELPQAEWLGEPDRETTDPPNGGTPSDATVTDGTTTPPAGTATGATGDGTAATGRPRRGFFTNGEGGPASALTGSGLTALSTGITVVGIGVTVLDMIRGGDD